MRQNWHQSWNAGRRSLMISLALSSVFIMKSRADNPEMKGSHCCLYAGCSNSWIRSSMPASLNLFTSAILSSLEAPHSFSAPPSGDSHMADCLCVDIRSLLSSRNSADISPVRYEYAYFSLSQIKRNAIPLNKI